MQRDPEWQYLDLLKRLLEEGDYRMDRTGTGTRALFGQAMRFDMSDGTIPLLTTKKVFWKSALIEMIWFLSGETSIKPLIEQGVHIWTDWPMARHRRETGEILTRDEYERRVVEDADFENSFGRTVGAYGTNWRKWPTKDGGHIDQISKCLETLHNNPYSRRNLFHGWNVEHIEQADLPVCHMVYQLIKTKNDTLNLVMYQRSVDTLIGCPFNLVGCAFILAMFAQQSNMVPGEIQWFGGDVHLYENHLDAAREQLGREPTGFPKLTIARKPADMFSYRPEDFVIEGYEPQGFIKAPVAV